MATIQSIIDRVTHVTKDYDHVRWTLSEIALWLNDAADQIATMHPRASTQYVQLTLGKGARQDLRVIDPDTEWIRLFEIVCNVNAVTVDSVITYEPTGATARHISRPALDFAFRTWRGTAPTATAVKEYAVDEREPFTFDVNPPVAAGTRVLAMAAIKPGRCMILNSAGTALEDAAEVFPLAAGYDIPAVDYVLYRAFSKDANDPAYSSRAAMHLQTFQLSLGIETRDAGEQ